MFLLLHGIGDYMALEEDNWSQQAVGISLNPGDMLLQLAPNVFLFLVGQLENTWKEGWSEDCLEEDCVTPYPFCKPVWARIKHFSHPEFCVPAKYQWQMQFLS